MASESRDTGSLAGIEINDAALQQLRVTYPELAASADLHLGAAETVLRELPDDSVDVIFTMAVLLHIHPSSAALFREIVRVARSVRVHHRSGVGAGRVRVSAQLSARVRPPRLQ